MSTEKQIIANRENAQKSTGPRTEAGKSKSSLNAVKTGLTGRTVILPSDEIAVYQEHLASLEQRHQPKTDAERLLVQSIADTEWRLARIPSLEAGIYALGRLELQGQFDTEDEAVRRVLMDAQIFLSHQRQLNNLSIQETRLRRQREKDLAELRQLQIERTEAAGKISQPHTAASAKSGSRQRPAFLSGFEISADEAFARFASNPLLARMHRKTSDNPQASPSTETNRSGDRPLSDAA